MEFAERLTRREFAAAYRLTSTEYRATVPQLDMQKAFEEMVHYIEPLQQPELMGVSEQIGSKRFGDVAWAYVAVPGNGGREAVSVIITSEHGALRIRDISWGRP
jgi:hypothetical protein